MTFDSLLRYSAVYIFCNPLPEGWDYKECGKTEKFLHIASALQDAVGLTNTILDLIFAYTLIFQDGFVGAGIVLLLGMLFARIVARRGNYIMYRGGLQWAPFFLNHREYYSSYSNERKNTLKLLYCLTFTEISVYLFEDALTLLIWGRTDTFDNTDLWEVTNAWFTLASAIMAMLLLLVIMFCSINCLWCQNFFEKTGHNDNSSSKFWSTIKIMVKRACLLCILVFSLVFYIALCTLFVYVILVNLSILSPLLNWENGDIGIVWFYMWVGILWLLAIFFACPFWRKAKITKESTNSKTNSDTAANESLVDDSAQPLQPTQTNDAQSNQVCNPEINHAENRV
uniref:Uncharacterized protein n=2 Tax=Ditylum brightwellii TaxID=49249 RepID=A0A7S4SQL3_9STRA|mmetsp:Transcript_4290/g.5710  ORF Transcript_4290/g.5710 Transcript_4290/m.5710 type:complete len:341 (-) Transcript_4290:104-1126(-)